MITLYDVVAVSLATGRVRIMATRMRQEVAQGCIAMAVARRGLDEEYYREVPTGSLAEGDLFPERVEEKA